MPPRKKTDVPAPDSSPDSMQHEYGHSSGDRNTRTNAHDWKHFKEGDVHTEHAEPPRRPDKGGER